MAKQKRLNANLIAFLTIMGVVVVVSVAALVIRHGTKRDPGQLAQNAQEREARGDLKEATEFYRRAYGASNELDPNYLIDAARCQLDMGEIGASIGLLRNANRRHPEDPAYLQALLENFWRIQRLIGAGSLGPSLEAQRRETAADLLKLDPNSALALVSQARALWALGNEEDEPKADAAAQKAHELAPEDPRVALVWSEFNDRQLRRELVEAVQRGAPEREVQALAAKSGAQRIELLGQAVAAHPGDAPLVTEFVAAVQDQARRRASANAPADEVRALLKQADDALDAALVANGDNAELHLAVARQTRLAFALLRDLGLSPADQEALLAKSATEAKRATELDPALYNAYELSAEVALIQAQQNTADDATGTAGALAGFEAALSVYDKAAVDTLLLWKDNVRARLRDSDRLGMIMRGYFVALEYAGRVGTAAERAKIMERAQKFLEDAQTKFPNHPITLVMAAEEAAAEGNTAVAITTYEKAEQQAEELGVLPARYWLYLARLMRFPAERLAELYRDINQLGEAARYADEALVQHQEQLGRTPPLSLILLRADIHQRLGENEQALALLDKWRAQYPDAPELVTARQILLAQLGRGESVKPAGDDMLSQVRQVQVLLAQERFADAEKLLQQVLARTDLNDRQHTAVVDMLADTRLQQARAALKAQNYAAAEQTTLNLLKDAQISAARMREALSLYTDIMIAADRRDAGLATLKQLVADGAPVAQQVPERALARYEVILSAADAQERDTQLRKLIEENPDELTRAMELYAFFATRNQLDDAAVQLDTLRKLRPEDPTLLDRAFRLEVARERFDQAAALLPQLSQFDDGQGLDSVGGATYRGMLGLARGTPEGAQEAIAAFEQARRGLPRSAQLETELARAYYVAGRIPDALNCLRTATNINPRDFEAIRLLMLITDQQAGRTTGEEREQYKAEAAKWLAAAAALAPDNADVKRLQEQASVAAAPLEALDRAESAWQAKPDDLEAVRTLAALYGRYAEDIAARPDAVRDRHLAVAQEFFPQALKVVGDDDRPPLARAAANFFGSLRAIPAGEAVLKEALTHETGLRAIMLQLLIADFYDRAGSTAAAERAYREAQQAAARENVEPEKKHGLEADVGMAFARFYQAHREWSQVAELCRWLLDRVGTTNPEAKQPWLALIEALRNTGDRDGAERELAAYLQQFGGTDLPGLVLQAQLQIDRRQRSAAAETLSAILKQKPDHLWSRITRGTLAVDRGDYDQAREDFKRAEDLTRDPQSLLTIHDRLAELYTRTEQYDLAEAELRAMLVVLHDAKSLHLDEQPVVRRLARLLYQRLKQFDRAQQLISEYMARSPQEAAWPFELGQLFVARAEEAQTQSERAAARGDTARAERYVTEAKQSYASAAPYFRRAGELISPANVSGLETARVAQMNALTQAGQPRDALRMFESLPTEACTPSVRAQAAQAYAALDDTQRADEQWRQALVEGAALSTSVASGVVRELRTAAPGQAAAFLRKLVDETPATTPVGVRLRVLLASELVEQSHEPQGALALLADALANVQPEAPERRDAMLLRARALEATGDELGAIQVYRDMLTSYPNDAMVLNNLAYALVTGTGDTYRPKEALEYAERVRPLVEGNSGAGNVLDTVGWVYFKNGELELAAAALEEALALDQDLLAGYLHLGQVYAAQGRTADARSMLTHGLELTQADGSASAAALAKEMEAELDQLK